jgi:hypothetical protein
MASSVNDPTEMHELLQLSLAPAIGDSDPRLAFEALIKENNALIVSPDLDNGRRIVTQRTAIHMAMVAHWAEQEHRAFGYDRPFAVAALGGTGRGEMTPCSDTDLALLFDDEIEGNPFRERLQAQTLHSGDFFRRYGFRPGLQPFQLEDMPRLEGKQLNAFIDLTPIYDPSGLTDRFRERIRATFDPFEHFLEVSRFGPGRNKVMPSAPLDFERLDHFDIKIEGLRTFLGGIWTLAIEGFRHSKDIYAELEDPRDLEAYEFLLRIRSFIHLRRGTHLPEKVDGTHPEDLLNFNDFLSFDELLPETATESERREFSHEVRSRILSARRRVIAFARGVIGRELQRGRGRNRSRSVIVEPGGLRHVGSAPGASPRDRSSAALQLLLCSQRYGVAINPSELEGTFDQAGDWLEPVPDLADLFYEPRGSLAATFEFLSQVEGAEERLFPGHDRFASSIEARVLFERNWCRGTLARRKLEALQRQVEEGNAMLEAAVAPDRLVDYEQGLSPTLEAALLDADHLAAVKLALKTKRLPVTEEDLKALDDPTLPPEERFGSGFSKIPLADYYTAFRTQGGFPAEMIAITEFLVANRRAFKKVAEDGFNDDFKVASFARHCGDEQRLRALFVFTYADRFEWESEFIVPSRWFNIRELYLKAIQRYRPGHDSTKALRDAGYSERELAVLNDFGRDFFSGMYRKHAARFGSHLLGIASRSTSDPSPKAAIVRDGTATLLGVAARDFPGLAACITGEIWKSGYSLAQANLFSAINHGLALDFFHVAPSGPAPSDDLARRVELAIREHRHISPEDESHLAKIQGELTLEEVRPGQYRLRHDTPQDTAGLVYALCYKVLRDLHGNIHGLKSQVARGQSFISIYLSLPPGKSLHQARLLMTSW